MAGVQFLTVSVIFIFATTSITILGTTHPPVNGAALDLSGGGIKSITYLHSILKSGMHRALSSLPYMFS
jgi:hypothetical protein